MCSIRTFRECISSLPPTEAELFWVLQPIPCELWSFPVYAVGTGTYPCPHVSFGYCSLESFQKVLFLTFMVPLLAYAISTLLNTQGRPSANLQHPFSVQLPPLQYLWTLVSFVSVGSHLHLLISGSFNRLLWGSLSLLYSLEIPKAMSWNNHRALFVSWLSGLLSFVTP